MNTKALLVGTILSVSLVAAPVQAHDYYDNDYPYGLISGLFLGLQLNSLHGHSHDRYYRHREYRRSDSYGYQRRDKHRRGHDRGGHRDHRYYRD